MRLYRKSVGTALTAAIMMSLGACSNTDDDNKPLDYESIQVNFSAALEGAGWQPDAEIGVFATCTRGDNTTFGFGGNKLYKIGGDNSSLLLKATDDDAIIALRTDHNYHFYAYYPYSASVTDPSSIDVAVDPLQLYSKGVSAYSCFVAEAFPTTVVPDVDLSFKAIFSVLELNVADDILNEDGRSELRSITLTAPEDIYIAQSGIYNMTDNTFTPGTTGVSNSITLDFGMEGKVLTSAYTPVSVILAPVTLPAEGLTATVTGINGESVDVAVLSGDRPTSLKAGQTISTVMARENDGIIPIEFPVEWSLGHGGTDRHPVTATTQPLWLTQGIWTCDTQSQAVCTWHKESDPLESPKQVLETVNSGKISSVGVKGIWTGDYFEFDFPVKKFSAGTVVTMSFPLYGRQIPVFWDIDYLDGNEWKTADKTLKTAYDPTYSMECTFTVIRGATMVRVALPFENAISSGNIKVRLRVADGSVQADTDTKCAKRSAPWTSNGAYGAPFYFYDTKGDYKSIKFSLD